jgi:Flp pilus assembly protein TadD
MAAESRGDDASALTNYERAAQVDDHFAELLYRWATCCEKVGKPDEARKYFALARDWDALQFRTDSRLNGLVRKTAADAGTGVHLVDLEILLAQSSLVESGVPGATAFHDHVHFTFAGDYLVASSLAPRVASVLQLPSAQQPWLRRDECARQLAYTAVDEMNVKEAFAQLLANPPFLDQVNHATRLTSLQRDVKELRQQMNESQYHLALSVYREAIAARPDDWMLRNNLGGLFTQFGQYASAIPEQREVVKRFPLQPGLRVTLGSALLSAGRYSEASNEFAEALRLHPRLKGAQEGLKVATRGSLGH